MNVVFFIAGGIVTVISFFLILYNWSEDRTNLLQNKNNVFGYLVSGVVIGIGIFCLPIMLFAAMDPVVTFETRDSTASTTQVKGMTEVYFEYDGGRIPIDGVEIKEKTTIPVCIVSLYRRYDLLIGRDEHSSVTISGTRCSEVKSFLAEPQVHTVLSGWGVTINQLQIPTELGY